MSMMSNDEWRILQPVLWEWKGLIKMVRRQELCLLYLELVWDN